MSLGRYGGRLGRVFSGLVEGREGGGGQGEGVWGKGGKGKGECEIGF